MDIVAVELCCSW